MNSSSFESPKPYLFALNLENSIAAFLSAQTIPIYIALTAMPVRNGTLTK